MEQRSHTVFDRPDGRTTGELLAEIADQLAVQRRAELAQVEAIVAWADANTIDCEADAATVYAGVVDTGIPIAGPGAPLVSESAFLELAATLGRSHDSARMHVGRIIETAWRLPEVYAAVLAGRCPVWKALRVAEHTRGLSMEAASFVDRHLGFCAGTATWAQLERLVAEAIVRFDPERAEADRQDAADGRFFTVYTDQTTAHGLTPASGLLDAADAADLDQAVSRRAQHLGDLGCAESLDVRRAIAVGELARSDLALDLQVVDPGTGEITTTVPGRKVELVVHLTDAALAGISPGSTSTHCVGRWEHGQQLPVHAEQIRAWCGIANTSAVVRPVVDLADHVPVDSYEIPDRLKRRVRLRDHHCAHPHCTKKAAGCDIDHHQPHAQGGATCPCQLVPLCRRHHRAKTFSAWRYAIIRPGTYLWTGPTGLMWLVDAHGTHAVDPPRPFLPDPDPPAWADPGWPEPDR